MKEIILSHVNLSEEEYRIFEDVAKKKEVDKNQLLFQAGKLSRKCFFIEKGILRGYRIIEGKEYTHHFYFQDWFAVDYESFLLDQAGSLYIESLTNAVYYEFDKNDLLSLYRSYHQFEKLGRIIAEKAYLITVEKLSNIQTLSLKEKYEALLAKTPKLFQKVPQKYIASYLGVSEQSLSRVKNQLIS